MKLISYRDFGTLRLSEFLPDVNDIVPVNNFEFMGDMWRGETFYFTEWLQLLSDPSVTRSVSISFLDLPIEVSKTMLRKLQLPFNSGQTIDSAKILLGEPKETFKFVPDRETLEYIVGEDEKYVLSLTFQYGKGLTYIVMLNHEKTLKELSELAK